MNDEEARSLAQALGAVQAERVVAAKGPLDVIALREELSRRLRSSGGRPTDPSWTLARQVPFKDATWERLRSIADEIGQAGPRAGPAQVAALLVERSLEDEAEWRRVLVESADLPLLAEHSAADRAGVSYRQFDDWFRRGWLVPASRRGRLTKFSVDESMRARWFLKIPAQRRESVAIEVRRADLSHRYLVFLSEGVATTARSRRHLVDLLEATGDATVVDQLHLRRALAGALLPTLEEVGDGSPSIARRAV